MTMGIGYVSADSIPRYAPPTAGELARMYDEPASLCDGCRHLVEADVGGGGRHARPRWLGVCAWEHDVHGDSRCELLGGPVTECRHYVMADGA